MMPLPIRDPASSTERKRRMSSLDRPVSTQISNIQTKTGMSLDELAAMARDSGLTKHGELRSMFKDELGLGHGDANALVHAIQQSDGTRAAAGKSEDAVLDEIYAGAKAGFRPIHDALMREITPFGDFDVVPKKGYVSLRRKKQFAMIGPKTNTRFEVGINAKDLAPDPRLLEQPKGSMCPIIVRVGDVSEVDEQLVGWVRAAFDSAG